MAPPPSAAARAKLAADAAAWAGNVASSVLIIFVNKALMGARGYGFHYGEGFACARTGWSGGTGRVGRHRAA